MLNETIDWRYEDVYTFNKITGVFESTESPRQQIERAMKIFKEECFETIEAAKNGDSIELLDGVCDVFVTLSGLMQVMEHLGFNVEKALGWVCDNNLEKFPMAPESGPDQATMLKLQPEKTIATYYAPANCYVYKDKDGKVKKPIGFTPVELQDLVPEGIWE